MPKEGRKQMRQDSSRTIPRGVFLVVLLLASSGTITRTRMGQRRAALLLFVPPGVDAFTVLASPAVAPFRTALCPATATALPTRIGWARRGRRSSAARTAEAPRKSISRRAVKLHQQSSSNNDVDDELIFSGRTTLALVGGQMLLVVAAAIAALIIGTPNYGLGSGIDFSWAALQYGFLLTLPLGLFAAALDLIENQVPALKDVTKATQRSVLALMGGTFQPALALGTAVALGLAAGIGEEMLFRGVMQYEIASRLGTVTGVAWSSIVFGLLHAVTPLYAVLSGAASVYFGSLYLWTDNLAVPIACHTIYDIGALFYAHWTVCKLSKDEMKALARWEGPGKMEPDVL